LGVVALGLADVVSDASGDVVSVDSDAFWAGGMT
jgi:hypothetical protein